MANTQFSEEWTQCPSGPVQVTTAKSKGQTPLCVACPRPGKNSNQRQVGVSSNLRLSSNVPSEQEPGMSSNLRLSSNVPSEQRQTSFCSRPQPPFCNGGNTVFTWVKFGDCGEGVTEDTELSLAELKEL